MKAGRGGLALIGSAATAGPIGVIDPYYHLPPGGSTREEGLEGGGPALNPIKERLLWGRYKARMAAMSYCIVAVVHMFCREGGAAPAAPAFPHAATGACPAGSGPGREQRRIAKQSVA